MQRTIIFTLAIVVCAAIAAHAGDVKLAKPIPLPHSEERQWISAAQQAKTGDGSSVEQTLAHAARLRPDVFRAGRFEIAFNGGSGRAETVSVDVWIGQKRGAGDAISLILTPKLDHGRAVSFVAEHPGSDSLEGALMLGRDAFLRAIDSEYRDRCSDVGSGAKLC